MNTIKTDESFIPQEQKVMIEYSSDAEWLRMVKLWEIFYA